jgi:hypothetical protein
VGFRKKEQNIMRKKKKQIDPDMPVGKITRIKDFLPPPEKLVMPERKYLNDKEYEALKKLCQKEKGQEKKVTKKFIERLKKGKV